MNLQPIFNKANDKLKNGFYIEALADFNTYINANPKKSPGAYINRGQCKLKLGDKKGAIEDYTTAISLNSMLSNAYFLRGETFASEGFFTEALRDFDKVLEIDPKDTIARGQRKLVIERLGIKSSNDVFVTIEIKSWQELQAHLGSFNSHWVFRGQTKASWTLSSSLERQKLKNPIAK